MSFGAPFRCNRADFLLRRTTEMIFWTGVGVIDMGIGIMFAMIILYFAHSRWWRIFSFLFFQFGKPLALLVHDLE